MTDPDQSFRRVPVASPRTRRTRVLAAMLAVVVAAAALITVNEATRRAELPPESPHSAPPDHTTVGGPFELVDQNGQTVTDRSFAGRKRLMVFAPATERDRILATLQVINSARELAGPAADRIAGIWIVTDPGHSSQQQRAAILAEAGGRWSALSGPEPVIAALMRAYFVPATKAAEATAGHRKGAPPAPVVTAYLMDEQGSFLSHRTVPPDPAAVANWLMQSL